MSRSLVVKLVVGIAIVSIVVVCYVFLKDYASLEYVKSQRAAFADYYEANRGLVLAAFFAGYVAVTAFSLPGAAVMTLVAGALFGVWVGTLLVSFASTIGATLAFLVARFILGESPAGEVTATALKVINDGMEREGAFYLFALRLIPAFSLFLGQFVDGVDEDSDLDFLLGQPDGDVGRYGRLCLCGDRAGEGGVGRGCVVADFVDGFVLGLLPLVAKRGVAWVRMRRQTTAE